jgi:hypothetical protein
MRTSLRRRIAGLIDREKPLALVSAAACGSDLLALEIAGRKASAASCCSTFP